MALLHPDPPSTLLLLDCLLAGALLLLPLLLRWWLLLLLHWNWNSGGELLDLLCEGFYPCSILGNDYYVFLHGIASN